MSVLSVKDDKGNVIPVPSIRGKSAYEYAKDGGYTGTEEEFAQELAQIGGLNNKTTGTITCLLTHPPSLSFLNRVGNFVEIVFQPLSSNNVTNNTTPIANVPEGFRPKETKYLMGRCVYNDQIWLGAIFAIDPDGNIRQAEFNGVPISSMAFSGTYSVL